MKTKYALPAALILPFFVFGIWLFSLEQSFSDEKNVTIRMKGYDPVDILSGRYLLLTPDWEKTDCTQFEQGICPEASFARTYRYYLPEFDAKLLDKLIIKKQPLIEMNFTYQKGARPMINKMFIDGKVWNEWLNQLPKLPQEVQTSD